MSLRVGTSRYPVGQHHRQSATACKVALSVSCPASTGGRVELTQNPVCGYSVSNPKKPCPHMQTTHLHVQQARSLPRERNESVSDLVAIFRITRQFFREEFFFVKNSPRHSRHKQNHTE